MTYRDKAFHFCGAFTATVIGMAILGNWGISLATVGSILLEVYQWKREPYYIGKEADTAVDLIVDVVGIVTAALIVRAI